MRRFLFLAVVAALAAVLGAVLVPAGAQEGPTLYGGVGGRDTASSDLLVIDPASGAVAGLRGPTGFGLTGLAINPLDGVLYGVTVAPQGEDRFLVRIDPATGAATPIGGPVQAAGDRAIADLTFRPDGTLYGWTEPELDDLVTIDLVTGLSTVVGDSTLSTGGSGLAYDVANDRLLFAGHGADGELSVIDPATGAVVEVLSTLNGPEGAVSALAFDCDGTLYGVVLLGSAAEVPSPAQLVTIEPDSGNVTILGDTEDRLDAIEFDCFVPEPEPVPEPVVLVPTFTG